MPPLACWFIEIIKKSSFGEEYKIIENIKVKLNIMFHKSQISWHIEIKVHLTYEISLPANTTMPLKSLTNSMAYIKILTVIKFIISLFIKVEIIKEYIFLRMNEK